MAHVDRARSMADMESIVFSLQRELQESRAGELALESQLQAVKVSITRSRCTHCPSGLVTH